jgi:hypothetical protein
MICIRQRTGLRRAFPSNVELALFGVSNLSPFQDEPRFTGVETPG